MVIIGSALSIYLWDLNYATRRSQRSAKNRTVGRLTGRVIASVQMGRGQLDNILQQSQAKQVVTFEFSTFKGVGVLLLEELEHAKKRGATIYIELLGGSFTSDVYHMTEPHPNVKSEFHQIHDRPPIMVFCNPKK